MPYISANARSHVSHALTNEKGFTLIELMIIVALLGIFAAIAVPSFTAFINNNRVQSFNNEVVSLLNYARNQAVIERKTIVVCSGNDQWQVKRTDCSSTDSLRNLAVPAGTSAASANSAFTFRYNGTSSATSIRTCANGESSNGYTIDIKAAGSIRTFARGKSGPDAADLMTTCS